MNEHIDSIQDGKLIHYNHLKDYCEDMQKRYPTWVKVEDKLPDNLTPVLVWYEYFSYKHETMIQTYGIGWHHKGFWCGDVMGERARCIAWQPLPAPYEGE